MEKKKNIILIHGEDRFGREEELGRFVKAFRERQSDTNIEAYRVEDITDWRTIENQILAVGLFVEKRLFVFRGDFSEKKGKGKQKAEKNETGDKFERFLKILENIDDDSFIIIAPDGPLVGPLSDWLLANVDVRHFGDIFSAPSWSRRFPTVDDAHIAQLLRLYQNRISAYEDERKPKNISGLIAESLEKLSLLAQSKTLSQKDIEESITLETGGKMFDLIDSILDADRKKSLELFRKIHTEMNINMFIPSLIGLLRTSTYVRFLKYHKISENTIVSTLKAHPYVVKKAYNSRIAWGSLREFYDEIVTINIAYRSGKGLHDPELGRIFGIERAIMGLKK